MTGPEHYRETERLLREASREDPNGLAYYMDDQLSTIEAAHVHATLALAAATALAGAHPEHRVQWHQTAGIRERRG